MISPRRDRKQKNKTKTKKGISIHNGHDMSLRRWDVGMGSMGSSPEREDEEGEEGEALCHLVRGLEHLHQEGVDGRVPDQLEEEEVLQALQADGAQGR